MNKRPFFLVLEGMDGSGKSSHTQAVAQRLDDALSDGGTPEARQKQRVLQLREPGSTSIGERLRALMLHEDLSANVYASLMFASRQAMVEQCIVPAFEQGIHVVCDRWIPSTFAYQSAGQGLPQDIVWRHEALLHASRPASCPWNLQPDLILYFDLPPDVARARVLADATRSGGLDVFERRDTAFFTRVRNSYKGLAASGECAKAWAVIDATHPIERVRAQAIEAVDAAMDRYVRSVA